MPELPDIVVYCERLTDLFGGQVLRQIRLGSPFVLRSVEPPLASVAGRRFLGAGRMGKRIILGLEGGRVAAVHLMIAGRLKKRPPGVAIPKKTGVLAFDFESATILMTEASSKKRASLHLFESRQQARVLHRDGVEPLVADLQAFREALLRENRTLKRALTDPRLVSGIGNAYSDEILFSAGLSPGKRTHQLEQDEWLRLFSATQTTLQEAIGRLRAEVGQGFPEKVTAFHPSHAVHGRYKQPCRSCGTAIQRIRYADKETNYCPRCQTGGKLLADRSLSRLLRGDFPKTIEELEGD